MAVSGILLIDKPGGWTSHDVVAKLRGLYHERRIGHSGTLDPMATGLLVVFIGRATRAVEFAENHIKEYIAGLRLGLETDTQDITGNILAQADVVVGEKELEAALTRFRGRISQIPPMYSAIKVDGQKLYEVARRGGHVERKPRQIEIFNLELMGSRDGDWILGVKCSKGTYIRTLCSDIGSALGCGGTMSSLRRISCGDFRVTQAHTIDEVIQAQHRGEAASLLLPTDSLFSTYPAVTIDTQSEKKCLSGAQFCLDCADGTYRVYSRNGCFLMLGEAAGGRMKTIKNFFEVR